MADITTTNKISSALAIIALLCEPDAAKNPTVEPRRMLDVIYRISGIATFAVKSGHIPAAPTGYGRTRRQRNDGMLTVVRPAQGGPAANATQLHDRGFSCVPLADFVPIQIYIWAFNDDPSGRILLKIGHLLLHKE